MNEFALIVSQVKRITEQVPDDAKIYIQRIEDIYFDKHGWEPILIPDVNYPATDFCSPDQFTPAWDAIYNKEKNILLIYGHY